MLVIRKEQIQQFIAADEDELVLIAALGALTANPTRTTDYPYEKLKAMVETGVARARSHGLTAAEDIAAFVAVMFETSPQFDEQKDIKAVLEDANFEPGERFFQLFDRVSDEAWEEAEGLYDPEFWFPAKG
jgi:hypothetical protein